MDPSDTGLNDQSQRSAAPTDLGGQPSSAQRTGANMPQGIYANASLGSHGHAVAANASHGHHGPAVAVQPPSHVYPAMSGMRTPLQSHFNTFVPPTPFGYGPLPNIGGSAMPPLSHSASRQYAGHVNLQQPRVQAIFDQQQQLEMMQYLQMVQHQQMQGSFQFPSTPHTMGTSLGTTQRPDEITTFTDVRMTGQNAINNGISSNAETVVSRSADPSPRTHDQNSVGELHNSLHTSSDE